MIERGLDRAMERLPLAYPQLLLLVVLASGAYLLDVTWCCADPTTPFRGSWVTPLSFASEALRSSHELFAMLRFLYLVAAVGWFLQLLVPYTSWLATIAFTLAISQHLEQLSYVEHVFQLTNLSMIALALAHTATASAMRQALRDGRLWSTPLFPRWAWWLILLTVGITYSRAGLYKVVVGGIGWANGLPLQLWVSLWSPPGSLRSSILQSRDLASALQWAALIAESAALFALPWRSSRALVGLGLVGFHLGQWLVFGWAFQANLALLVVVLMPVEPLVTAGVARLRARFGRGRPPPASPLLRGIAARLDLVGWYAPIR